MGRAICGVLLAVLAALPGWGGSVPEGRGGVGGLVLAPTRLVLGPRDRAAEVNLFNRGTAPATYRIDVVDKRMTEEGALVDVPEGETDPLSAAQFLRYAPRQVTLGPGETQKVRLLVRRPPELAEAEYRSHLLVRTVPEPRRLAVGAEVPGGLRVAVTALPAVSIPVIVRHGELGVRVEVSQVELCTLPDPQGRPKVRCRLTRQGGRSAYGDVAVTYVPSDGVGPRPLGLLRGVAVYASTQERTVEVPLQELPEGPAGGSLRVAYLAPALEGGALLAEARAPLR